jgi:hypothetical protein
MIFVETDIREIKREIERLELSCIEGSGMYSLGAIMALQWILTSKVRPTEAINCKRQING